MTARCRAERCGRPLHTDESRVRGYGPVCWRRLNPAEPRPVIAAPVHAVDPEQIPLPLEATVDEKPKPYTVTLQYTTTVTFTVDADSPQDAYQEAVDGMMYGDLRPESTEADSPDLIKLAHDGHEVEFNSFLDLYGPKDKHGLSPWKYTAHDASRRKIAEGHDVGQLIADAFAVAQEQG